MKKISVSQMIVRANSHLKNGEILEAEQIYAEVLMSFPRNVKAQQGLRRASFGKTPPQKLLDNLIQLINEEQLELAVTKANNLAIHYPKSGLLWNILGIASAKIGQFDQAIKAFERIITFTPNQASAYYNLGNVYKDKGLINDAIEAFTKALELKSDYSEAYKNLRIALSRQGNLTSDRHELLFQNYQYAMKKKTETAEALLMEGAALSADGKLDEAVIKIKKCLSLLPEYTAAHNEIASILLRQGKPSEAINHYSEALLFEPENDRIRVTKLHEQAKICDWNGLSEDKDRIQSLGCFGNEVDPFRLLSLEDSPERHLLRAKIYSRSKFQQKELPLSLPALGKKGKIRLAYFSADFGEHPVSYLIAKVLEQHDRDRFDVFGYSLFGKNQSNIRHRLEKSFDKFQDMEGRQDLDIVYQARKDEIDIAIDLNGFTQNARTAIFAYRAAPVQINYLGYPGTVGAKFIDYIVADKILIPDRNQKYFLENLIYLPNSYLPTDNSRALSEKEITRGDVGLPEHAFVFCCFNSNYKITPAEFDIWMRILNKVTNSILWLRKSNSFSQININNEAAKRAIDPSRIVFAESMPMPLHLARHKLADLFIDTFAFNAHTTATEALWAGLPVVTKLGQGFAARVAGSLLNAIGLPELVTTSEREYEEVILELATNPAKLAHVKDKLATNRLTQPLFNTELYTKHLENGYQQAYQNYFDGKSPKTIIVPR